MVLIAPGIARYTVNGTYAGAAVANIIDMQIDTTGGTTTRAEGLDDVCGDILNNWTDHIIPLVADDYVATSVSYVDLDSSGGATGERSSTSAETWPASSTNTGAPFPANVSVLVTKQIVGSRGRRNGRMYIVGATEALTDLAAPNTIPGGSITTWNTALASFLSGINDAVGGALDVQRKMVVVHTQRPTPTSEPVYNGYSDVESLTLQATLATQRRRLR